MTLILMEVLRTLVVEDEGLARRRIEKMVKNHENLELTPSSAESGADAINKILKYEPELILLDIELKDYNAFEILERIGPLPSKVIFVTAFNNYAVNAFEVEAVDYLLKPFTDERFHKAINRALSREDTFNFHQLKKFLSSGKSDNSTRFVIPEGNIQHFMEGDEVIYIQSQGYYANVIMNDQKKLIRISLKLLESKLPISFSRINKSTIINRKHIKKIIQNKSSLKLIMTDKNDFYVTEKYRDLFPPIVDDLG